MSLALSELNLPEFTKAHKLTGQDVGCKVWIIRYSVGINLASPVRNNESSLLGDAINHHPKILSSKQKTCHCP